MAPHAERFRWVVCMATQLKCGLSSAFICALGATLLASLPAGAEVEIRGKVTDGTTDRPVANQTVLLLMPREGMQAVAKATTDAKGHYAIKADDVSGGGFFLVEVNYQDAKYHAPVKPSPEGTASADVTVYDATSSESALRIQLVRILCRAEGAKARVRREYTIVNSSSPPRAYVSPNGTFHFHVPQGGEQPVVAVTGLLNMPLPETPEAGKSPGEFFIRYPIRPGPNTITVEFDADYSSMQLDLSDRLPYGTETAELYVTPANLSVDSKLLKAAGVDQADSIEKFEARNLAAGAVLEARLSGEAVATPRATGGEAGESNVKVVPNTITRLGWPLLACVLLVSLWALGVRVAKEWPAWKEHTGESPVQKQRNAKVDALIDSLADLDELFEAGKIAERDYWKERLELKAKIVALLKKGPPASDGTYATRRTSR
jgi:hypothetical protein